METTSSTANQRTHGGVGGGASTTTSSSSSSAAAAAAAAAAQNGHNNNNNSRTRRSPSETGDSEASGAPRLFHTLTACTRCRSRKTRCDAGLPKCGPCERSGTHCEFFDSTKQKTIPRTYVVHLQNKVRQLEEEVAKREALLAETAPPNNEDLVRGIGAVRFGDYEHYKEPRYVGSSSGVTVTRLVLESAKKDLAPGEFKDMTYQHRKNAVHSLLENHPDAGLAARVPPDPKLPPRSLCEILVRFFCGKALYMLPVLHEPTFMKEVADVYEGSKDPFKTFKLRMVLAISLQKYSKTRKYEMVADSYFLAGLQDLEAILEPMDHSTLQCLLVMVQYALVKPTRIAAYHIVGLCVRLCIQLGYHQERTIMLSERPLDPITKDMRRRLFWTLASMEYGLSHVLGRPSAFATSDAYVDVKFYEPVDDVYITAGGILPAPPSRKKLISMHFFEMRRLQAEVRRTLYQNPAATPKSDQDPWFIQMKEKCDKWKASCPNDDEGSGLSERWFNHRYNNILIFMYRPSPQIPQPSLEATLKCYECAALNVHLEKEMYESQSVELTWVFLHQIYTVTLTIIWATYNPHVRTVHPKQEVEELIRAQIKLLLALSELWPGAEAAADLFLRLAGAALRNYDSDLRNSPVSTHSAHTPPPHHRYHDQTHSPHSQTSPYAISDSGRSMSDTPSPHGQHPVNTFTSVYSDPSIIDPQSGYTVSSTSSSSRIPPEPSYRDFQGMMFDPNFMQSMFQPADVPGTGVPDWLQQWDPSTDFGQHQQPVNSNVQIPQYLQSEQEVLNQQAQHDELMRILESEAVQGFGMFGSQQQRSWGYGSDFF
ncbi:fungal-specific transcription factor domain-containing protein [Pyronema domesticum]|uniref:Similar to Positive regulator of purine utilization acc. no. P49413 n=1 Tax=Pyronema omphalodes (strain CBS 100304) TaxID=1076935 RepID=U4LAQ0_PYROM|nr:fungal-specific transcription factor domain-containing protein [Pyronema domesticum]CCX15424.1 Similar to Positive regulator of purine utilization; acc. no. P49413 [Pyronema omphalodes CBS 100304]